MNKDPPVEFPNKLPPELPPKRLPPVLPPKRLPPEKIELLPPVVVEGNLKPPPNRDPEELALFLPKSDDPPAVAVFEKLNNPPELAEGASDLASPFFSDPFLSGDTVLTDESKPPLS